jgi:hypothetical protein
MLTFNEDISNNLKVIGNLIVVKTSEVDGKREEYHHKNLVVTAGKSVIAARLAGNTAAVMSHMAVGTGNTSPVVGNTTLETELARVALTVAGGTPSSNTISYSASYPAGTGTGALAEAGIFNDSTVGSMLCRTVFPVINKSASDAITVTWTISIV